ncbi:MAG: hypothetical protein FWF66_02575 [Candidatus Bathyarchaeota archaeon]|nr:hypothetical protein [Candidatus Termiticorpusculum sp.]
MNIPHLTSRDIAAISICSALYAAFGILTGGISFFGIGFLPAVIIPAVFAALYGPWVGGISGAIGIFIRDILVHGNPTLSLVAGVPPNFILFFLIGYLYTKNINLKQTLTIITIEIAALLAASILLLSDFTAYTGLTSNTFLIAFILTIIVSLAAIVVISIRWKEWSSYAIGAVIGQIIGGLLLSITVWLVSPMFLTHFGDPLPFIYVLPLFIWLIITELPFIILAVPIIKIMQKVFPNLQRGKNNPSKDK